MKKHSSLSLLLSLAILSGCGVAKTIPLSPDNRVAAQGLALVTVAPEVPSFRATTPGRIMTSAVVGFGLFGGLVADLVVKSEGRELCEQQQIQDPALQMTRIIASGVGPFLNTRHAGVSASAIEDDDEDTISAAFSAYPLALSVRTIDWGFAYYSSHWGTYRLQYEARVRLIDTRTRKILAQVGCESDPDYRPGMPSYDDLVRNRAAYIKQELDRIAQTCASKFLNEAIGRSQLLEH